MQNITDVLVKAREIIKDPVNWTQDALARDAFGAALDEITPYAVCYCTIGAIAKACGRNYSLVYAVEVVAEKELSEFTSGEFKMLAHFNDCNTHDRVLGFFDYVIDKRSNHEKPSKERSEEEKL